MTLQKKVKKRVKEFFENLWALVQIILIVVAILTATGLIYWLDHLRFTI